MARVVIIGASIGGLPAVYEARALLGKEHQITVISNVESFHFVPSNPWIAVGWRKRHDISFALGPVLEKKGIALIHAAADRIEPEANRVMTAKGEVPYDYLIIATGPKLNFAAVPGLGPSGYSQSVCNVDHAEQAWGLSIVPEGPRPRKENGCTWRRSRWKVFLDENETRGQRAVL